jgi:hypothetical protein
MDARKYLYFALLNFSPALLGYSAVLWMISSSFLIVGLFTDTGLSEQLFTILMLLGLAVLPLGLTYLCYRLCMRTQSWKIRFALIWLSWQILSFVVFYVLSAAMAGVSMAVVDGGLKGWELETQVLAFAAFLLLSAQIIILPLTGLTTWHMKKKPTEFFEH